MTNNEALTMGTYDPEDFNVFAVRGEHAQRGSDSLRWLSGYLNKESGKPLPAVEEELDVRYLRESSEGYYFHAFGPGANGSGEEVGSKLLHAVVLYRDPETRVVSVEGIFNKDEPATLDAMYYLWLRKIIPNLSRVRFLEFGESFHDEASGIVFGEDIDERSKHLLGTFGIEEETGWQIPIPGTTIVGSPSNIQDKVERVSPAEDKIVALVSEGSSSITRFFERGKEIGSLTEGKDQTTLRTAEGEDLAIATPYHGDNYQWMKLLADESVARQLGLVTLKRALSES